MTEDIGFVAAEAMANELLDNQQEDWDKADAIIARRIQKRVNGVDSVQRSPAYAAMGGLDPSIVPDTLDPYDLSISKRTWERLMKQWRHQLRWLSAGTHVGNRWDPLLEKEVNFTEMCRALEEEQLSRQHLQEHWDSLKNRAK